MADFLHVALILLVSGIGLRFAYFLGRDAAEQDAYATVADLRSEIRSLKLHIQRQRHRNDPRTEVDQWMQ